MPYHGAPTTARHTSMQRKAQDLMCKLWGNARGTFAQPLWKRTFKVLGVPWLTAWVFRLSRFGRWSALHLKPHVGRSFNFRARRLLRAPFNASPYLRRISSPPVLRANFFSLQSSTDLKDICRPRDGHSFKYGFKWRKWVDLSVCVNTSR